MRKARSFKTLHCQLGFIRNIEPQSQFGRVPTRAIRRLRDLSRPQPSATDRAASLGTRRPPKGIYRTSSEQAIQRAVCQHLRQRGATGLVWWHTPNGGRRTPVEAAIFSGLAVRAGVSDLILLHDGRAFALELKTERGRPTAAQMQFLSEFRAAGGEASIADGLDKALRTLEIWGVLRGRAACGFRKCVTQSASASGPPTE